MGFVNGSLHATDDMIGAGNSTMTDQELLTRITINPKVLVGKPVIRGTRLSVEYILNPLAHGSTIDEIVKEYHGIKAEDVRACILFATKSLENTVFMPLAAEA